MPKAFHTVIDMNKLADALESMGFIRQEADNPANGRADRAAPDDWPGEPANDVDETDPWAEDEPAEQTRSQARSAPRGSGSSRASTSGGRNSSSNSRSTGRSSGGRSSGRPSQSYDFPSEGQHEDRVGKLWEFGLSDAPECEHGLPAAEVTKPRARWRAWACPLGFGKDYKQKCEYWEYAD